MDGRAQESKVDEDNSARRPLARTLVDGLFEPEIVSSSSRQAQSESIDGIDCQSHQPPAGGKGKVAACLCTGVERSSFPPCSPSDKPNRTAPALYAEPSALALP